MAKSVDVNPSIFRAYDIRGLSPKYLNEESAELIGIAYGNLLDKLAAEGKNPKVKEVVISRDHRKSGVAIKRGLIRGLRKTGKSIVDIGVNCTPAFYFALCRYRFKAGCQITASHNLAEYNGIKFNLAKALPVSGETGIFEMYDMIHKHGLSVVHIDKLLKTTRRRLDVTQKYIDYLLKKCKLKRPLNIVIDTGNGVVGKLPEKVFRALGCNVKTLYAKPDDRFPHHQADPHLDETLKYLQEQVVKRKADLGIAFDGDGDRLGLVDETGAIVDTGHVLMMLARKALAKRKGAVIYEVRISRAVINDARKHGGKVFISRAGHSYLLDKILKKNGVFGGELSGHIYNPIENYPYDDGIFSALKVAEAVSGLESLHDYVSQMPWYHPSPEIYIKSTDKKKFIAVDNLIKVLKKKHLKLNTIDGVRIEFSHGWAVVRASNTTPHIKCRFEGRTAHDLIEIIEKMRKYMRQAGIPLRKVQ